MESYARKKILASIIFSSIFIAYLSFRLNNITQNLEGETYKYVDAGATDVNLKRCRSVMPIMIKFDPSLNYEEKAAKLVNNPAINYQNICRSSIIDVCMNNNCGSMELRLFLIGYFDEQITLTAKDDDRALLKRRIHQHDYNRFVYDLLKDEEFLPSSLHLHDNRLRTLGTMIALAAITETYLELEFESHFLCNENSVNSFLHTLEYIDKDFSDSKDKTARTAREKFISPFLISRGIMLSCISRVFGKKLYNYRLNRSSWYHSNAFNYLIDYNSIDLNGLLNSDYHDLSLNLVKWKRNSQYTRSSKIFFRALKQLDYRYQIKIYEKVTGFSRVPDRTGFSRLPITRIISGEGEMFHSKFVVVIDPNLSMEELVDKLIVC